jgi:hypothetical protein
MAVVSTSLFDPCISTTTVRASSITNRNSDVTCSAETLVMATTGRSVRAFFHSFFRTSWVPLILFAVGPGRGPRSGVPRRTAERRVLAGGARGGREWHWAADCCYDHSVLNAPLAQLAEQRTLNPRVRGSSPWRRTRTDLGFHHSRSFFMCPVCPHVGSMFARELGPGRGGLVQSGRIRIAAGAAAPDLARPMVYTFARRTVLRLPDTAT